MWIEGIGIQTGTFGEIRGKGTFKNIVKPELNRTCYTIFYNIFG